MRLNISGMTRLGVYYFPKRRAKPTEAIPALWGPVGVQQLPWRRRGRPSGAGRAPTNSFLALLNVLSGFLAIYG